MTKHLKARDIRTHDWLVGARFTAGAVTQLEGGLVRVADLERPDAQHVFEADAMLLVSTHDGFTYGEIHAAFAEVQNPEHWKKAIDHAKACDSQREAGVWAELVRVAVIFMTGSVPTIDTKPLPNGTGLQVRIRAAGYYAAVGA